MFAEMEKVSKQFELLTEDCKKLSSEEQEIKYHDPATIDQLLLDYNVPECYFDEFRSDIEQTGGLSRSVLKEFENHLEGGVYYSAEHPHFFRNRMTMSFDSWRKYI